MGSTTTFLSGISTSFTGTVAYSGAITQNSRLTWFKRSGTPLNSVREEGYYTDFRLSPSEKSQSEKLLAFSLVDPKTSRVDVWMTDLARTGDRRLTRGGGVMSASPIFSPDGKQFVFRTNRLGSSNEFYARTTAGGENEQLILGQEMERAVQIRSGNVVNSDWSSDSRYILFSVPGTDTGVDLWRLPLTGDKKPEKYLATPYDEMQGVFSHDSRMVAYTTNDSGKYQVFARTFPEPSTSWPISITDGYEPRWRPDDGGEIYYLSEDRKLMAVKITAGSTGPKFGVPSFLFQTHVPTGVTANRTHYVPNHDGTQFLINTESGDTPTNPITVVQNWTAGLKK